MAKKKDNSGMKTFLTISLTFVITVLIILGFILFLICMFFPWGFHTIFTGYNGTDYCEVENETCLFCCKLNQWGVDNWNITDKCLVCEEEEETEPEPTTHVCEYFTDALGSHCGGDCTNSTLVCGEFVTIFGYDCGCVDTSLVVNSCVWEDDESGIGGQCGGSCPTGKECRTIMSEICDCVDPL